MRQSIRVRSEGSKRQTNAYYAGFLNLAEASLAETEYLLLLALDLGYSSNEAQPPIAAEIDDVARMLHALRVRVEQGDPQLWTQGSRLSTRGSGACGRHSPSARSMTRRAGAEPH